MNGADTNQMKEDLAFFGKINASISHELKNILAIISEAAGLLNDLTEMAATGKDVDPQMLKTCSQDIIDEIQRGFTTIRQMNIFSHSVDDPAKEVNPTDCLNLMVGLAGFLSFACQIKFVPPETDMPMVYTNPFRLQNLIYQTLVFAFKSVGPEGAITVSLHSEKGDAARIHFSGLGSEPLRLFPYERASMVAGSINAEFQIDDNNQTIDIMVPQLQKALH